MHSTPCRSSLCLRVFVVNRIGDRTSPEFYHGNTEIDRFNRGDRRNRTGTAPRGGLALDAREGNAYREQEFLGGADAPFTIPGCGFGEIGSSFWRDDDVGRHRPRFWRISVSAAVQDIAALGFCR